MCTSARCMLFGPRPRQGYNGDFFFLSAYDQYAQNLVYCVQDQVTYNIRYPGTK